MTDQNIFVNPDVASGGTGTDIDPYKEWSEVNQSTGGDKSIFDWVAAGDDVKINYRKGTTAQNDQINFSVDGAVDHPITVQGYGSDGGRPLLDGIDTLDVCIDINSQQYIDVDGIDATRPTNAGVDVRGTSSDINVKNMVSSGSGNQAYQNQDTASCAYENIVGHDCVDDGFSMHDDAVATIEKGEFFNVAQGINIITNSSLTANQVSISNCSDKCIYTIFGTDDSITLTLSNFIVDAAACENHPLDIDGAQIDIHNMMVKNIIADKFGLAIRDDSTVSALSHLVFLGLGTGIFSGTVNDIVMTDIIMSGLAGGWHQIGTGGSIVNSCMHDIDTKYPGNIIAETNVIASDPQILSSGKLLSTSPCIDTGAWIAGVNDTGKADFWGKYVHRLPNIGVDQGAGAPKRGGGGFLMLGGGIFG